MATTVGEILDEIASLSVEDQEMVDQIVHKRLVEAKREEIRADHVAALEERNQGPIAAGTVDELFGSL